MLLHFIKYSITLVCFLLMMREIIFYNYSKTSHFNPYVFPITCSPNEMATIPGFPQVQRNEAPKPYIYCPDVLSENWTPQYKPNRIKCSRVSVRIQAMSLRFSKHCKV